MGTFNYIWAVDPGSVATGVAVVHSDDPEYFHAEQFTDPKDAYDYLAGAYCSLDTLLIEMYRSAGHLNQHAQATIEVIGFIRHAIEHSCGKAALLVTEQSRLSGQREAADLMNGSIDTLRMDPNRKDAFSALSHACAYRRRISNG